MTRAEDPGARRPHECLVATSWVLHGSSLKGLARSLAHAAEGVIDFCGFDGHAVAGQYFTSSLALEHPELQVTVTVTEHAGGVYRFGGGTARANRKARAIMRVATASGGTVERPLEWEVVPGTLPLLLGRSVGAELGAIVDVASGTLYGPSEGGRAQWHVISQSPAEGVMRMSLKGRVATTSKESLSGIFAAVAAEKQGDGAEVDTDVESVHEAQSVPAPGVGTQSGKAAGADREAQGSRAQEETSAARQDDGWTVVTRRKRKRRSLGAGTGAPGKTGVTTAP